MGWRSLVVIVEWVSEIVVMSLPVTHVTSQLAALPVVSYMTRTHTPILGARIDLG